jgi:hypothetical protein
MTPLGESNRRRDNEIPRSRNHWDIGHVGLGIPLGHPDGGYRDGASASISTQPTTALAFGCVQDQRMRSAVCASIALCFM